MWDEIKKQIEAFGGNFESFKKSWGARLEALEQEAKQGRSVVAEVVQLLAELKEAQEDVEARARTPRGGQFAGIAGLDAPEVWRDRKSGQIVPVFGHKDRFSTLAPNKTGVSVGRWLRGVLTGRYADDAKELSDEAKALATSPDASGGYTVPAVLSAEFIDLLRSRLVLSQAGARAVPMTSKTLSLAKLTGDATVEWHTENSTVNASDLTLGIVELEAKTVVGLVKFSLELSQDSLNVEEMITRSLSAGVALAIDRAGLGSATANGPSGVLSFTNRQRVVGVGTLTNFDPWIDAMGELIAADVPESAIGAVIHGPGVWKTLAKLKTGLSGDQTSLVKPASLQMPFLTTSHVPDSGGSPGGISFMGAWSDLLYGVRQDIRLHILRETFLGSNLQIAALVYARVDFAAAREQSFATIEDIS